MSVLIKDMKMPSSCNGCLFGHWLNPYKVVCCELLNFKEYPADYTGYKAKRLDKCPLVEVPTPHGRLIDADRLMRVYEDRLEKVIDRYGVDSSERGILSGAMKLLMIELGIVEAEGDE